MLQRRSHVMLIGAAKLSSKGANARAESTKLYYGGLKGMLPGNFFYKMV